MLIWERCVDGYIIVQVSFQVPVSEEFEIFDEIFIINSLILSFIQSMIHCFAYE